MHNFRYLLAASAIVMSGSVFSASDGSLGLTSSGTSVVTVIKDNAVQISNVNDLDLGAYATLAAAQSASDDVCVFSSTAGYNLTVTSANGTFELRDGAAAIPYSMTWNGGAVDSGVPAIGLAGDNTSLNCSGGTNATFEVTVASADFNAADPGTYTDTLTLLVQPE